MRSKLLVWGCVVALTMACAPRVLASQGSPDPAAVTADVLILRPACLVATVVGSVIFVVSLPFAIPSKSVHKAADALVKQPAYATFKRPLGDLDNLNDN